MTGWVPDGTRDDLRGCDDLVESDAVDAHVRQAVGRPDENADTQQGTGLPRHGRHRSGFRVMSRAPFGSSCQS